VLVLVTVSALGSVLATTAPAATRAARPPLPGASTASARPSRLSARQRDASSPCAGASAISSSTSVSGGVYSGASSTDATVRFELSCTPPGGTVPVPGSAVLTQALILTGASVAVIVGASERTDAAGVATYAIRPLRGGSVTVHVVVIDPSLVGSGQICNASSPAASMCTTLVALEFPAEAPQVPAAPYRIPNPPRNLPPPALVQDSGPCTEGPTGAATCASPCYGHGPGGATPAAPGCVRLAVAAIDEGRASEHLRPMVLPVGFDRLGVGEQLFVLVNLERIARGVPPLAGLVSPLDAAAQKGAARSTDPAVQTRYGAVRVEVVGHAYGIGGTWAGGEPNAEAAVRDWIYDDGWGGSRAATGNVDCSGPAAPGCWGHRMELLGEYSGTNCATCVAGVGYVAATRSFAVLVVRPTSAPRLVFGWDTDVLRHLPVAYERVAAPASAGKGP